MKMKCPKGVNAVSWDGEEFVVNKAGLVDVPARAVPDLIAHGLEPADESPDPKPKKAADDEQSGAE